MLNNEIAQFQAYNPRVETFEGPKSYRIDAEVPGFRKEDLSIEFPKKRLIRIVGKRRVGGPVMTEIENATGDYIPSKSADPIETREAVAAETTENSEPTTATESDVGETESKEVRSAEAGGQNQVAKVEQNEEISFTSQWSLPEDVDVEGVKAKLDHGILSIFLPKTVEAEFEKKINID
jgi:HSP20 family molecular chaperone IbpA